GLIGVLIVYNAVKVAIYTYREEIGIMRLVGASNTFIRAPYWVEGILYSLLAVGITGGLMFMGLTILEPAIKTFFYGVDVSLLAFFTRNAWAIFGSQFAALALLCIISSSFAMGKYLKV
ncbi:MAG: FtsX-like permease family protein, partial [bacterium]